VKRPLIAALLITAGLSHAAPPTVAVMPFKVLGSDKASAGEAVRETVTSDLRDVPGLKVLERSRIDQVIVEQNLATKRTDLDPVQSVRVGTLLGATLIVAGAYQRAGNTIRLTARLVKVETGEIIGTAKVDGPTSDFLHLQDRVTGALLGTTGLKAPPPRPRPKLKSARTIELYGDAVLEPDEKKRQKILRDIVDSDPDFHYASRDLDALQKRMGEYGQASSVKLAEKEKAQLQRIESAKEPLGPARALFAEMVAARRYRTLAQVAEKLFRPPLREEALYHLFVAREGLHQFDQALQVGEQYLRDFPTGARFREVESRMHEIAETKKKRAALRAEYESDLKEHLADHASGLEHDWSWCIAARWNDQVNELMLDGCQKFLAKWPSSEHSPSARFFVILALAERGDFDKARPLAEKLLTDSDEWDEELRKLMSAWPTD
jgi:TolB-like protein